MNTRKNDPDWFLWLFRHPFVGIVLFVVVVGGIPLALVTHLDRRIAHLDEQRQRQVRPPGEPSGAVTAELPRKIVRGQRIYVPIYSNVFVGESVRLPLTATLSIRNTDAERALSISKVEYYDTEGQLVRNYLEKPLQVKPLGSTDFVVQQSDMAGGAGANFIVEWVAGEPVLAPLVEAVMASGSGTSFVRAGVVVGSYQAEDE